MTACGRLCLGSTRCHRILKNVKRLKRGVDKSNLSINTQVVADVPTIEIVRTRIERQKINTRLELSSTLEEGDNNDNDFVH